MRSRTHRDPRTTEPLSDNARETILEEIRRDVAWVEAYEAEHGSFPELMAEWQAGRETSDANADDVPNRGPRPMRVPLTPEHERLVRDLVDGERYLTPGEVVRDALHLLEERERLRAMRLEDLRREIQKGFDSGPAQPFDPERLKRRIREKLAEQQSD